MVEIRWLVVKTGGGGLKTGGGGVRTGGGGDVATWRGVEVVAVMWRRGGALRWWW